MSGRKVSKCPVYVQKCSKCGRLNHFSSQCMSKRVDCINSNGDENANNFSGISDVEYLMKVSSKECKLINTVIEIEGQIVKFQVDSSARVNVISVSYVKNAEISPCDTTLEVWTLATVKPVGKCRTIIRNCRNRKKYSVEFIVVDGNYTPLLGKRTSEQMGLITVNYENISATTDILNRYSDVFDDEIGTFRDAVHLTLDPDVKSIVISKCRVPTNLKSRVCTKI